MAPNRAAGGMAHSPTSGIFFPGDGPSQAVANSNLSSSMGNSSLTMPGNGCATLGKISGDVRNTVLNSIPSSGASVAASSLVTDANSALSGGPRLQRSASINTESYMRLPASPMSFSSNNICISGSSLVDGSQSTSNQDPNFQPPRHNQQHQAASIATSLPTPRGGQVQLPNGSQLPGSLIQDPGYTSQLHKKPRLDIKQEDILQKPVLQQYLRQEFAHLQNPNSQLQALIQQQRLRQQQQLLQSMPPVQRAQLLQQQQQQLQQLQLRQQLQQPGVQPVSANKRPYDGGVCSRRLMQYLYHQRQRPQDNSIAYWRKFVSEYYSPRAKKRWCLSLYENVGHRSLGVFPQASMDSWQCDICGLKSGRGFEATFEVLSRLNEIKFGSGVIDELLFLDLPRECRFSSGIMMLEYVKAVQESVYDQLRVVREGQLRIIFAPDLKILSWEFCARRHEELLPRRLVQPQVTQLLQVARKCQSTVSKIGEDGVSQQDLETNSNMVVTAGRQLASSVDLQSLNDLGFSKRYVRCLQISEVVNSMKDLMDFCRENKVGPIEGLKNFPRHVSAVKLQPQKMQEMDQLVGGIQGVPTDPSTLNKLMSMHHGLQLGGNQPIVGSGSLNRSAQAALELTNYQNLLSRQNSMNSSRSSLQQEPSPSFSSPNQVPPSPMQGPSGGAAVSSQSSLPGGLSGGQQPQLLLQRLALHQQNNDAQRSQTLNQHAQDMSNNSGASGIQQQTLNNSGGRMSRDGVLYGGNRTSGGSAATGNGPSSVMGPAPSRSNSFKGTSNSETSGPGGNSSFRKKSIELPQSLHLSEEMVAVIANDFPESSFLGSDLDDNMNFDWKA